MPETPDAAVPRSGPLDGLLPPGLYENLHARARDLLGRRRAAREHLGATSLVHEAYLRLAGGCAPPASDRSRFLAAATRAMRFVLVDQARRQGALKRRADASRRHSSDTAVETPAADVLTVHELLDDLAARDERKARIVELRFFGGLELEEIAAILDCSLSTVKRDWQFARAWLQRRLGR